jgi:hypothetical protein
MLLIQQVAALKKLSLIKFFEYKLNKSQQLPPNSVRIRDTTIHSLMSWLKIVISVKIIFYQFIFVTMLIHLFFFLILYTNCLIYPFFFFWSKSQSVIRLAVLAKFVKSSVALYWDEEMLIQWLKYKSILLTARSMSVGIMMPKFTAIAS